MMSRMTAHACKTPPITVSSWPRDAGLTHIRAGEPQPPANGPEKPSQAPLGTIWICECLTVWVVESSGWVIADEFTTRRELKQAGRVGI